jgi:cytochrome P450
MRNREERVAAHLARAEPGSPASILIFTLYFHGDDENLPYADRFAPELWLDERPGSGWPLVPFSGGPGICPARDLVPMIASATIAALLASRRIGLKSPTRLSPDEPRPGTLDNFSLRFGLEPQPDGGSA